MISLLLKFRDIGYIFVIVLLMLIVKIASDGKLIAEKQNFILNSQIVQQNMAIDEWQTKGNELEKELRLKEQEASVRARDSQKRVHTILSAQVPKDCEGAVQWGIANIKIAYKVH